MSNLSKSIHDGASACFNALKKPHIDAAILALIFVGLSRLNTYWGSTPFVFDTSLRGICREIAVVCVLFAVLYIVTSLLYALWDKTPSKADTWRTSERGFYGICLACMLVCWGIWLCAHYPGAVRDDTITQYFQSEGLFTYYTQHPIFSTLCFGIFWKFGLALGNAWLGLFIFLWVQAIITANVFAYILLRLRQMGAPRFMIILALGILSLLRTIYQPLLTMSKDAWNAWMFILVVFYIFEIIASKGAWLKKWQHILVFTLVMFCCIASKRTMLYVCAPALVVIAIVFFVRKNHLAGRVLVALAAPVLLLYAIWNPLIDIVLEPIHTGSNEIYSVFEQQIFYTLKLHPDALSADDEALLAESYDIDAAVNSYNPWRSDEVTNTLKPTKSLSGVLSVWAKLGIRYPLEYFKAFWNLAGEWFSLTDKIMFDDDLDNIESEAEIQIFTSIVGEDPLQTLGEVPKLSDGIFTRTVEKLDDKQTEIIPFTSYGFSCTFIPFVFIVYALSRKKANLAIFAILPFMLVVSFMAGPIALYWYTIPACFLMPVLLVLPCTLKD